MDSLDTRETLFIEVLLPLNLNRSFTYRVPFELNDLIELGKRVSVPFGKNKLLAGIIWSIDNKPPLGYQAKYILDIIDNEPIIDQNQMAFWMWISKYYLCSLGLVMGAGLPAGLKLEGEAKLILRLDFDQDRTELDSKEVEIIEVLRQNDPLSISQVAGLLKITGIHKFIRSLYLKDALYIKEDIETKYVAKKEKYIAINPLLKDDQEMGSIFNQLEKKAPKQLEVLMRFISKYGVLGEAIKSDFQKVLDSPATLNTLIKKDIFIQEEREISRINQAKSDDKKIVLSKIQAEALVSIKEIFHENKPALLHGITSSGKTHIYLQLINEALELGGQVLYLLPEIALTSQLLERLNTFFGEKLVVAHSKFSNNERVEVYDKVRSGEPLIILGTRSAIFQPFKNLKLVVIDEEHESSFKQFEPAPRFNARDCALYLANQVKAHVILGSATPAFESYFNALNHKYGFVELHQRHDNAPLPEFHIVDMQLQKKQKRNFGIFSDTLIDAINLAKTEGKQSILFQNKKGYVPVLQCTVCSWTPTCINCDISLTYYKYQNNLRCHYCGYSRPPVNECQACGNTSLELIGYGTERIEDELALYTKGLKIQRLDYNTTRKKTSHKKIIDAFGKGEIDVLIGTQMVAKGLDFDNVRVVGVINADHLLNFPDFRAYERTYQLITQVAGRAGRRTEIGQVYIQTSKPDHEVLRYISEDSYKDFFEFEIAERERFNYPPFQRLIKITLKHRDALELHKATQEASNLLKREFGSMILGPEKPHVSKIRNYYLMNFLFKLPNEGKIIFDQKFRLQKNILRMSKMDIFKGIKFILDVDPM